MAQHIHLARCEHGMMPRNALAQRISIQSSVKSSLICSPVIAPRHPARSYELEWNPADLGLRVRLYLAASSSDDTDIYVIDVVGLMPELSAVANGKPALHRRVLV